MKMKPIASALAAAGLGVAVLAGFAHADKGVLRPIAATAVAATQAAPNVPTVAPSPAVALPDFTSLVEKYGPAVVNVSVTGTMKTATPQIPGMDPDDPLWQFFRRFQGPGGGQMPRGEVPTRGLGSGFIVSNDGIILTNAHVVDGADEVNVRLTDKREFKAKVIGVDKPSDVAVLKIDAGNLPTVRLGDSTDVRVGEWVIAIGSPYGFDNTVTAGIVSAKSRSLPDGNYVPFIQTDVAVNPGNSGGPLFNMKGEVVGINSQIYSRTGGFQGLSFAIPIDMAIKVKDQLQQHGHVTRGRLGVTIQNINQELAESFGLKKLAGALVSSVEKGGPASKAGLQPGDVILKIDGKEINQSAEVAAKVAEVKPGTSTTLQVWRNGTTQDVKVTVGELKDKTVASNNKGDGERGRLGLAVRPLTPEEQQQAEVNGGVVVSDVSGPAAKAGIQPGDVILSMNGTPVKSAEQLRELVAKAGKHIALLVQREDAQIFVPVDLG
jgi:serine protease Do